jgi:hypothetical protein
MPAALLVDGVRLTGTPGGSGRFVTCAELDALAPATAVLMPSFDINGDIRLTIDDLHVYEQNPADLDGDGSVTPHDRQVLISALRFSEASGLPQR